MNQYLGRAARGKIRDRTYEIGHLAMHGINAVTPSPGGTAPLHPLHPRLSYAFAIIPLSSQRSPDSGVPSFAPPGPTGGFSK